MLELGVVAQEHFEHPRNVGDLNPNEPDVAEARVGEEAHGLAAEQLTFATKKDAVLAISFTPYASETISLAQAAHQRGVPVAAITDSPFSPLAQLANQWIEVSEANFEGFRSMAATLTLAMTLTVAIAERQGETRAG